MSLSISTQKLKQDFCLRDTVTVARDLLGRVLIHDTPQGRVSCMITETEAYTGKTDKACHSYRGDPNGRARILYESGGCAYVYLIYGMYYCFNVTTCPKGQPEAVLIRSAQPLDGLDLMFQRRNTPKPIRSLTEKTLLAGPGRLCTAMGIGKEQYGLPLWGNQLYLCEGQPVGPAEVGTTARINIAYAEEAADFPYRFVIKDSPYLSVKWKGNPKTNRLTQTSASGKKPAQPVKPESPESPA